MSAIRQFLRWWLAELGALVPEPLRSRSRQRGEALVFSVKSDAVAIDHRRDGKSQPLGQIPGGVGAGEETRAAEAAIPDKLAILIGRLRPEATRCEVRVQSSLALIKEVALPLAAAENLRQVLAFEMERQTPFRAEDVYFDFSVLERNTKEQQVKILLGVVPRNIVDSALVPVRDWDLSQQVDRPERSAVSEAGVGLTFASSRYRSRIMARFTPALAMVNVFLLLAVALVPLSQQNKELKELESELETTQGEAEETLAVQDRIAQLRAEAEFLTQRSAGHLPVVELLEELSALLPDSTWLFRLEVKDGKVQMQGTSVTASALIATLEQSEHLANVRFISPVLREANSGRERFHLSADITEAETRDESRATARPTKRKSG